MIDDWTPIEVTGIEEPKIYSHNGMIEVRLRLNAQPLEEWQAFFDDPNLPPDTWGPVDYKFGVHDLHLKAHESVFEQTLQGVKTLIEHCNKRYENEVLPRLRAQEEYAREQLAEKKAESERLAAKVNEAINRVFPDREP